MDNNLYMSRKGYTGYYIPSPNDPYVYLTSLMNDGINLSARIGSLFNAQLGITNSPTGNAFNTNMFQSPSNAEEVSLKFLKEVAESQRAHEIQFIDTRIKELKSLGKIGSEEQIIIDALEVAKDNPKNFDYKTFITAFNMVITNLNKYKSRLQGFNKTSVVNTPQVNLVQQLEATLNDFSSYRVNFTLQQEEMIRQLTLLFLQRPEGQQFIAAQIGKKGVSNVAAATAMIQQQLAQFLYDKGYLKYNKEEEYSFENFIKTIDKLKTKFSEFETDTNINSIYQDQQLLDEIIQMYGITVTDKVREYKRNVSQKTKKALDKVRNQLQNDPIINKNKYFQNLLKHVHVTWKANTKYDNNLAFHDELVSSLASAFNSHKHLGNLNLATDMLLGHIVVDSDMPNEQANNAVQNTLNSIYDDLSSNSIGHDADQISKEYLDQMEQLNNSLKGLSHAFVFHESNKSFNSLERGKWPQKNGKNLLFGRNNLNLFNYINSINNLGAQLGISTDWLTFAAYNLADNTLGAINKNPLESYFAIFAGMLMFDDFAIIGRDIAENSMYNNVTNIHLYKLQDTYFPASVFLDATYQALMAGKETIQNTILNGNAFTVSIQAPNVPYTRQEAPSLKDRWPVLRDFAQSHNKISIEFASGFLTLMRNILP